MAARAQPKTVSALVAIGLATLVSTLIVAPRGFGSERHPALLELEGEVICPTCHTTLDQSNAPAARRIEHFIQQRIAAGDTKSEIKAKLVAQFGPAILAAPPRHGFDLLAWWLPIIGVVGAGAVVGVGALRWSRESRGPPLHGDRQEPALDPELERRVDDELARFE